jgi:hypothetical protein
MRVFNVSAFPFQIYGRFGLVVVAAGLPEPKGLPLIGGITVGNNMATGLNAQVLAVVGLEVHLLAAQLVDVESLPLLGGVAVGHNGTVGLSGLRVKKRVSYPLGQQQTYLFK